MWLKQIIFVFLLVFLVGKTAIAQNTPDFTHLKAGEVALYDGYLFSPNAISKLISTTEEDKAKLKLEYDNKLILANIELEKANKIIDSEKAIYTKLLSDTVTIKDRIIENKLDKIEELEARLARHKLLIIATFLASSALTVAIIHYSTGI